MAYQITAASWQVLADHARVQWADRAACRLHHAYPAYFSALAVTPRQLVPLCAAVEQRAAPRGIKGERDLHRLALVALSLGHCFWDDPRFRAYAASSLDDTVIPASRRALAMAEHSKHWLRGLWQHDDLQSFSERLTTHIQFRSAPSGEVLHALVPGHSRNLRSSASDRYIEWLRQQQPIRHLRTPSQQLAYLACCLVHGAGWHRDPQYPLLVRIITTTSDPDQLANRLLAVYAGMTN